MDVVFDDLKEEYTEEIAKISTMIFTQPPWSLGYTVEDMLGFLKGDMKRKGFFGLVAKVSDKIVGFTWGFLAPEEDVRTISFSKIRPMLKEENIDPDKCFYGAETVVLPEYQKQGIGTTLIKKRTELTKDLDITGILSRTSNENMVKTYKKIFGDSNVLTLFKDPVRTKRTWYYIKLNNQQK